MTAHHHVPCMKTIIQFLSALLAGRSRRRLRARKSRKSKWRATFLARRRRCRKNSTVASRSYAAAWPLVETYPAPQIPNRAAAAAWMHPQYEAGKKPEGKCYTDVEGGLGWWRDTHFPTTTPKFIMGGAWRQTSGGSPTAPATARGTWEKPRGQYGVAQFSPWLLFPLDGLNLKHRHERRTLRLRISPVAAHPIRKPPRRARRCRPVNQCWTLFLNTANFKGPVAFFTPFFWSQATLENPEWAGLMLDSRPVGPNKPIQMETQYIPAILSTSAEGKVYGPRRSDLVSRQSRRLLDRAAPDHRLQESGAVGRHAARGSTAALRPRV